MVSNTLRSTDVATAVRLPSTATPAHSRTRVISAAAFLAFANLMVAAGCGGGATDNSREQKLKDDMAARKRDEAVLKAKQEIKPLVMNSLMHGNSLDRIAKENGMTPEQGRRALNTLLYPKTALPNQRLTDFHRAWLREMAVVDEAYAARIQKEFENAMGGGKN